MMTPAQFYALAVLIRTTEPARSAARLVLVDGMHPAEAAERAGVSRQSAYNASDRVRRAYIRICEAGPWPEREAADAAITAQTAG